MCCRKDHLQTCFGKDQFYVFRKGPVIKVFEKRPVIKVFQKGPAIDVLQKGPFVDVFRKGPVIFVSERTIYKSVSEKHHKLKEEFQNQLSLHTLIVDSLGFAHTILFIILYYTFQFDYGLCSYISKRWFNIFSRYRFVNTFF